MRRWDCSCIPTRPGSCASPVAGRASTSSAFTITRWSRGVGEGATTCTGGRRTGRCARSGPRSGRQPAGARWAARSSGWSRTSTTSCGVGRVFPLRQLGAEVRPARPLRPGAPGDLCQHQARTPRPELAAPLHLGVVQPAGDLPSQRENTGQGCACLAVNDVGKPGAGEPHARFDRGPLAKQQPRRAGTDAPAGKPTGLSPAADHSLTSQRPTSPRGCAAS